MGSLQPNGSLVSFETWLAAIGSSACIGFTSLVPWLFNLTFFEKRTNSKQQETQEQDEGDSRMKYLLSFAIGAMLGDIFFHLIPESIESHLTELGNSSEAAQRNVGLSVIAGIFLFIIVEMVLQKWSSSGEAEECEIATIAENIVERKECEYSGPDLKHNASNLQSKTNNHATMDASENSFHQEDHQSSLLDVSDQLNNNYLVSSQDQNLTHRKLRTSSLGGVSAARDVSDLSSSGSDVVPSACDKLSNVTKSLAIDPAGYLNLIANGFDNFTHGLAIGASFLVGTKVGLLTTFVIFIHEIPHEICDYAILVKSGFSRWAAVKAQSSVSLFGIMGTALALYVKSVDKLRAKTVWILPFSAGGFLYIALVTLLPDILDKQSDARNSCGQIASVILGIAFMGVVALL